MKIPRWIKIIVLVQVISFFVLAYFIITRSNLKTIVEREIIKEISHKDGYTPIKGIDYFDGEDAYVDYKKIFNEINRQISAIPKPKDGVNSFSTHTIETVIKEVPIKGDDGEDAPLTDYRCKDFPNKLSEIQLKRSTEEAWIVLYKIPHKCTGKTNE